MNSNRRSSADERTKREDITMRYIKFVICAAILLFISGAANAQQDFINNFAGGGPNNVPATQADVNYPLTTATDSAGNFYIVSGNQNRVFKVSSTGTLTVLAGNGFQGYSGDGGPATQAELYVSAGQPQVAVDSSGNVYIPDTGNCIVRVVNHSTGNISTFAGTPGYCSYGGDGNAATSAGTYLYSPEGAAVDSSGNVYISDYNNERIRQVNTSGIINTVAGNGTFCAGYSNYPCGDGGPATSAELGQIYTLAVDGSGNVFIADSYYYNQVIRLFTPGGNIKTVAGAYYGTGTGPSPCAQNPPTTLCGDGGPATSAGFEYPYGVAADAKGNIFIADLYNYDIREVYCADSAVSCSAPAGKTKGDIYTVAGIGGSYGDTGNGGVATSATLGYAYGVAVDSSDDIFIPDYYDLIVREVTHSSGDISTVAGNGTLNFSGNNIPATNAVMNNPWATAFDSTGNAYIADRYNCVVRKVSTAGIITNFAGTPGSCGETGDSGPATSAELNQPLGVAVDPSGNVYIADFDNYLIRVVNTSGNISIFAGNGGCYSGDGPATSNGICAPEAVAADSAGNVYIADTEDGLIRKVTGGNMTTIAGNYSLANTFSGDGGPATNAGLYYPVGVAIDSAGNLYISDYYNQRVRKVNTSGIINTFAGNGYCTFTGDGGAANNTSICYPENVITDPSGDVIFSDSNNQRIRLVDGAGNIHTIAGTGTYGYSGPEEDVLATTAELYNPYGLGIDGSGNIYIGDTTNNLVRIVSALAELNSSPSSATFNTQLVGTTSPAATLTLTGSGPLTISSITPSAGFSELDDCPGSLTSGSNCTVDVYFTPTSAGVINGTLTVADNAFVNSPLVVNMRGTATDLTITPNPLAFSVVQDGTPAMLNVTVTGSTTYAATSATLTGDTTDYSINSNTCVGLKTSCVIGITFNPGSAGTHNATLWIHDSDPTSAQSVPITGSGCATGCASAYETFTPNPVNFGAQTDKVSSLATKVTFANNNTTSLTITKPVATTGFKVNVTGLTAPICSVTASTVVAAGGTCSFNVVFDPTVTGAATGTVKTTFPNDGHGNIGLTLTVTGEGSAISFTPSPVAIKATMINTTSAKTKVTIKNVDSVSLTLNNLVSSAPTTFVLTNTGLSPACNLSGSTVITAGLTCVVDVAFAPGATFGTINGTITATYSGDANDTSRILSVSGVGTEMKETGALAFGTLANPGTLVKSVTVENEGTITSTITAPTITGTGAAPYSVLPYNSVGPVSTCLNGTVSLTHTQTCTLSVQFTPPTGTVTSYAADLNINSTGGGPVVVAISGKN